MEKVINYVTGFFGGLMAVMMSIIPVTILWYVLTGGDVWGMDVITNLTALINNFGTGGFTGPIVTMIGVTMDGEDKFEVLARYVMHKSGVWATCIYNYAADDFQETEVMDKMELGLGYSFKVWDKLYVDPNYTMPVREDANGEREGTLNLSVSYKL